jgi:hypothetical protein
MGIGNGIRELAFGIQQKTQIRFSANRYDIRELGSTINVVMESKASANDPIELIINLSYIINLK